MHCDINLLTCAIFNIIDNSIIYNKKNGTIHISVSVEKDKQSLEISIEDTGIGIQLNDIKDIFNPFCQVKSPSNINKSHCGLGLPLAKKIIALHGGIINVESVLDVGSVFKILLPL